MAIARTGAAATLLPNGLVLVAGGLLPGSVATTADAELYNPISNTWVITTPMPGPGAGQSATLLPNGQVLIAGGLAIAVEFNPLTNTWSPAGNMAVPRGSNTTTLLPNGEVLFTGGRKSPGNSFKNILASAELYDPNGPTFEDKVYDATTAATPNSSNLVLFGVVGSDTVLLNSSAATGTFASKSVGSNIMVNGSGFTIFGPQSGDYFLLQPIASANITPAPLTIIATPNTKTYNSTTTAAALPNVIGVLTADTVAGLAEVYTNGNAGGSKTLSVSAYTINDGNGGNNYKVATVINTSGQINPAALTIRAVANTKTYDGTTTAAAIPTVSDLAGNDTIAGLSESYSNADAGTGKLLSVSAYTINDANGGKNYAVSKIVNTTGVINKGILVIKPTTNTKSWDGTTSAAAIPTVTGLARGDSITGLTEVYSDTNVATGKTLSVNPGFIINNGNSGKNYTVTTGTDKTGVINPPNTILTLPNSLTVIEPPQGMTYTVYLPLTVNLPLNYTVSYQTVNGRALAGTVFVAVNPGTVHVNDANNTQPSVLLPITIRGGAYQQPGGPAFKSFTVQLNFAVNNGSGNALTQTLTGMPNTVTTINLQQVFAPKISIAANQASASQEVYVNLTTFWPSNSAFSASQYAQAGGDVCLNYSTSVGGAFFSSATVRIAAANFNASGTFLIPNVRIPSKPPSGMFTMTLVAITSNAAIDPFANSGIVGYP